MSIQLFNRPRTMAASLTAFVCFALFAAKYLYGGQAVDPRVTMDTKSALAPHQRERQTPKPDVVAVMESEPARTAARISEATALAFSASLYAATEQLKGRTPRGDRDLVAGVIAAGLLPPGLTLTGKEAALASAQGILSIRYRPAPLTVEVVSFAAKPDDGPALLVRLPEETSEQGDARLYIASSLKDPHVPPPFAPAAEIIALGWSPENLRSLR